MSAEIRTIDHIRYCSCTLRLGEIVLLSLDTSTLDLDMEMKVGVLTGKWTMAVFLEVNMPCKQLYCENVGRKREHHLKCYIALTIKCND